ncbi:MAG TPA: hypothetical protein VIG80_13250 [Bacillaceae bacterium]
MRKILAFLMLVFILISFYYNVLALMNLVPIYITSPLLFISLMLFFSFLNGKNRFRGFH